MHDVKFNNHIAFILAVIMPYLAGEWSLIDVSINSLCVVLTFSKNTNIYQKLCCCFESRIIRKQINGNKAPLLVVETNYNEKREQKLTQTFSTSISFTETSESEQT